MRAPVFAVFVLAFALAGQALAGLSNDKAAALRDLAAKNDKKAVTTLRKAADKGDLAGQFYYGVLLHFGYGVKKDEAAAVAWYRKAADKGYAQAQFNLGNLVRQGGAGLAKDVAEAAAWYRKAAQQGHAGAQTNLGYMLSQGEGMEKNEAEAVAWYRKAAEQGHAGAQTSLAYMLSQGQGVEKNEAEAAVWYRKAAEQNDPDAQNNLGWMLENGRGVARDEAQALTWYRKAMAGGDDIAKQNFLRLDRRLNCAGTATTRLFDMQLSCANRDTFRAALKQAGLRSLREEDRSPYDLYDSAKVLERSSELSVGYTRAGELAVAQYEFPALMDSGLVVWVRKLVEGKYGPPDASQGDPGFGEVVYVWRLKDGVEIVVRRGWPSATATLSYTVPQAMRILAGETGKARQEPERPQKQLNAF